MNGALLSLIVNGVMMVLLGATIFYAVRLSQHLKVFRDSRRDLDRLVKDMGRQFEKADAAIAALRQAAKDSGKGLQNKIDEARALSDELQLMTESGHSIASRMEKQTGRRDAPETPARARKGKEKSDPSFAIRDPEFDRGEADQGLDETALAGGEDTDIMHSRAERELYEAMRKRGKSGVRTSS